MVKTGDRVKFGVTLIKSPHCIEKIELEEIELEEIEARLLKGAGTKSKLRAERQCIFSIKQQSNSKVTSVVALLLG